MYYIYSKHVNNSNHVNHSNHASHSNPSNRCDGSLALCCCAVGIVLRKVLPNDSNSSNNSLDSNDSHGSIGANASNKGLTAEC